MSELRGRCDACGKAFRVPEAGRVYRCKACGGKVRPIETAAEPNAAHAEHPAEQDCPACGAVNPAGAHFCEECGASFDHPVARHRGGDRVHRKELTAELKRAKKAVAVLRFVYVVAAMASTALTIVFLKLLRVVPGHDAEPYILLGTLALLSVLYAAGAVEVARQPFFWAVLLASLGTLDEVLRFALGGLGDLGPSDTIRLGLVAATWIAVPFTIPVARIVREHPDFWLARSFGSRKRGKRGAQDTGPAGPPPAVDWPRLGRWLAGAGAAVALACGIHFASRLPRIDGTAAEFQRAWNEERIDDINALVAEEHREKFARSFERSVERKAWTSFPRIELFDVTFYERDKLEVLFASDEGPVETKWQFLGGRWELRGIDLTGL